MSANDLERTILVYENWTPDPQLMGTLYRSFVRGQEIVSFEYEKTWIENPQNRTCPLDPELSFYAGRQYPLNKSLFGLFADSCPDRWGRLLMKRREAILAKNEARKPDSLTECSLLLGVYDEARMGALRFRLSEDGTFQSSEPDFTIPPWISLRDLEAASWEFENDENALDPKWLRQLLAPGSSLGGARPKATIKDEKGYLWIAKFPSRQDENNSGAWEMTVHDLAQACSLHTVEAKLIRFSKNGATYLSKRFDRNGSQRIHFSSAMTLLGKMDGASAPDGTSYLELAAFLTANGASPQQDLRELWKRILFNMAVSNTDDHLRNHGFLMASNGWRLSPLYDVNPVPFGGRLSLNVNEKDNLISLDLAIETAAYFDLSKDEANRIAKEMIEIVQGEWERIAVHYGLGREAIESMRPAFSFR